MSGPMSPGPYLNDDGDWWVPVEASTFREARAAVVGCLSYAIPEDGTLLYRGKTMAWLGGEEAGDPAAEHVLAFHFQENRRW